MVLKLREVVPFFNCSSRCFLAVDVAREVEAGGFERVEIAGVVEVEN
jgi:hypothetical protein